MEMDLDRELKTEIDMVSSGKRRRTDRTVECPQTEKKQEEEI